MRRSCLVKIGLCLVTILASCYALDMPASTSFGESHQNRSDKPQHLCRIGTIGPAGISYMKYIDKKLRELTELINHQVKFELYAGGVLGDEPTMVKMVQEGKIDGVFVSAFGVETVAPETLVLSLPYIFRDEHEMDFIIEKYEPILAGYARNRGIEILGLFPIGSAQIFSTIPISGFDELKGRKVMLLEKSDFFIEFFRSLGWQSSVSLSFSKVEAALSSGKVDVVFANPASVVLMGWYPYIRYVVMEYFSAAIVAFFVNSDMYQNLPEEVRSGVAKFNRQQRKRMLNWARRDDEIAMLGLMKRGVNIIRWSPEEIEKAREVSKLFWRVGEDKWYPRKLLNDIERDLEEYRSGKGTLGHKR